MKIAFKCPHTKLSGGVKVIFDFANGLVKHGFKVDVLCKRMFQTNWYNNKINFNTVHDTGRWYGGDYDCIIDYGDGNPFYPHNTKHALFLQGFGTQSFDKEVTNLVYKYDFVIATSKWLYDLSNRFGQNTWLVSPGVDKLFVPKKDFGVKNVMGGLAHKADDKNTNMLLNVFSKMGTKFKNMNFVILSARQTHFEILDFDNINTSIFINPPVSILPQVYKACDVWISTSLNEGFGLTTLEAMACGVPVVWINSYGLLEHLKNKYNCVIVNNDKEQIIKAALEILQNEPLRKKLIEGGIKTAKKFDWNNSILQFSEVLKKNIK